jgi:hypothetical protein
MLGKIVVILLVAAIFWMILAGKCSPGSKQGYMPYLPTERMCDMVPEYWPEECSCAGGHGTKREDVLRADRPLRENCCGAGKSAAATQMHLKLKEKCCGAI